MRKVRCAIYTRKSSEDGLEQEFNSLDAQREACEAYIASQKHEGWVLLPDRFDDGGKSGGNLERPALQALMTRIDEGDVDQIVVYKIDRLTRSLPDFAKLVDRLDAKEASFVSVTQSFNTATSMGRLTLNVLLSFAQFEREVTAERIRDKLAASKKKGLWMGGHVPMGYDAEGRTLKINEVEAKTIRTLYDLYWEHKIIRIVKEEAERLELRSKRRVTAKGKVSGGGKFGRGHLHHILSNPVYAGRIRHKTRVYEGQHPAIIDPDTWDQIQVELQERAPYKRGKSKRLSQSSMLIGKVFDETGDRLTPTHSQKSGKRLRYYTSHRLTKKGWQAGIKGWRLPAQPFEEQIVTNVLEYLELNLIARILVEPAMEVIQSLTRTLDILASQRTNVIKLISRIEIAPGSVVITLDPLTMCSVFNSNANAINTEELCFKLPFQTRKRGVETKLIIGHTIAAKDKTLIRNLGIGHRWLRLIKDGTSLDEICEQENTSRRRIQQLLRFTFLSPEIAQMIIEGRQPIQLTSNWIQRNALPQDWQEQRELIDAL